MANDAGGATGLVGEKLNIVAFVMDYVEFHFNGAKLKAMRKIVSDCWTSRWASLLPIAWSTVMRASLRARRATVSA